MNSAVAATAAATDDDDDGTPGSLKGRSTPPRRDTSGMP